MLRNVLLGKILFAATTKHVQNNIARIILETMNVNKDFPRKFFVSIVNAKICFYRNEDPCSWLLAP